MRYPIETDVFVDIHMEIVRYPYPMFTEIEMLINHIIAINMPAQQYSPKCLTAFV